MTSPTAYFDLDDRLATLALWYVVNTSLSAFYKLTQHFGGALSALTHIHDWTDLGIHHAHLKRVSDRDDVLAFVSKVCDEVARDHYALLFVDEDLYPKQLTQLYDPPPILFYRGDVRRLSCDQIAIVGTRHPTPSAQKTTFDIAQYLAHQGLVITSGLAVGVDRWAHLGALSCGERGMTVGVLGTGIDVCYPKNHHALYAQIISEGGVLVSELLPATPATKHNFPRRNRLVAGLSLATIVTEATRQSGSLISARLTAEQGKQVFAIPSTIDNPNAEGCHHLIREGATLIYHPNQVLEDLNHTITPRPSQQPISTPDTSVAQADQVVLPSHLNDLWQCLSDTPTDLDSLMAVCDLSVGELLGYLLELEMLGLVVAVGGRYAKA